MLGSRILQGVHDILSIMDDKVPFGQLRQLLFNSTACEGLWLAVPTYRKRAVVRQRNCSIL